MKDISVRASRPASRLGRALLTLLTVAILVGPATPDAGAAVGLVRFEASWQSESSVLVVWETSSELGSEYFTVYRALSQRGPWDNYVDWEAATGDEMTGATYSFADDDVTSGVTYWYLLEETDSSGEITPHGPITPTRGTSSATSTPTETRRPGTSAPTATPRPGLGSEPTATRQFTNTPPPTADGAANPQPTQTRLLAQSAGASLAAPTRSGSLLVTTPTPVGGIPAPPPATLIPEPTSTPEVEQVQPAEEPTETAAPPSPAPELTPTPSPTAQRLAAAPKETSQPLVDASSAQVMPAPATQALQNNAVNSRFVPLIGGGALAAAAILAGLALLIWRRRAG